MGGVILKGTFSDRDPVVGGCAACVLLLHSTRGSVHLNYGINVRK